MGRARLLVLALATGLLVGSVLAGPVGAQARPQVLLLRVEGAVDPFVANLVERGVDQARRGGFDAVLLSIDTPGGLDSSMRRIVQAILGSPVPVVCYTEPQGARAASAGTFIMLACPVNAMAPGTNIGAAHPVGVSGAIEQQKVTNDAAAFIRSLASRWGRNADWAERSVRASVSVPAEEAVELGVVDLVAPTRSELLRAVDGRTVQLTTGPVTLRTAGAALTERTMGLGAGLLHGLIDPNLAFLFFNLGLILVVVELLHPGLTVPGVLGTLLLVTAFVSFGFLPVRLAGVVLLVAAAAFFLLELKHPGIGLPTVGGAVSLVLGGLLLFDPAVPNARVSPWLLTGMVGLLVFFFGVVVNAALRARRLPPAAGLDALRGAEGVAVTALEPKGQVHAAGEDWSAESSGGPVPPGTRVRVVGVSGLTLIVEPVGSPGEASVGPGTSGPPPAEGEGRSELARGPAARREGG